MKIDKIDKRLIYIPDRSVGTCTFSGDAYPNDEVLEILKEDEIAYIRNKLSAIIEMKKEIFGDDRPEFYGLHPLQRFFDLKNRCPIRIQLITGLPKEDYVLRIGDINQGMLKSSNISNFKAIRSGTFWNWKD